jgi:hypothetical protein
MSTELSQIAKNPPKEEEFQVVLECEEGADADDRLMRIFEFLLDIRPAESSFTDFPKVV